MELSKVSQSDVSSNTHLSTSGLAASESSALDTWKQWWTRETSGDQWTSNAVTLMHASVFAGAIVVIRQFGHYMTI